MKKAFYTIIAVLVIVGIGYYAYGKRANKAEAPRDNKLAEEGSQSQSSPNQQEAATTTETIKPVATTTPPATAKTTPPPAEGTFSSGEEVEGPDIVVHEVVYDGVAFIPSSIDIKKGDYITFRNKSTKNFWPASAPHPTHTNYPAFDPKEAIAPGKKWDFQFTQAGSWKYHDHLNPSATGVVNVSAQ